MNPVSPFQPGDLVVARYRVDRELGVGANSRQYRAFDLAQGRPVALKVLRTRGREHLLALHSEFRLLSGLYHPHLTQVLDWVAWGTDDQRVVAYTATLVEGAVSLADYAEGRSWQACLSPLVDALRALEFLHRLGLRHGDVKADNVLVDQTGRGVLIDLGCAAPIGRRLGKVSGTLGYIAPELLRGEAGDTRADLFSVGVMLRRLFGDTTPALSRLIAELMAPRPASRCVDTSEVIRRLGYSTSNPLDQIPRGRAPRLLGRSEPWKRAMAPIEAFLCGRNNKRSIHIAGHSGIGRTRLLSELKWHLQERATVISGYRDPATLIAAARHRDNPAQAPPATFEQSLEDVRALAASETPVVLVLDDTHLLSDPQRRLYWAICRSLNQSGNLLLLSAGQAASESLAANLCQIELTPLGLDDLRAWASGIVDDYSLEQIIRLTAGYPALVERIFAALAAGTIRETDLSQLERNEGAPGPTISLSALSPKARVLLGRLAIENSAHISSEDSSATAELVRLGWVHRNGHRLQLARPAEATAIVDSLPPSLRESLHDDAVQGEQPASTSPKALAKRLWHLIGAKRLVEAERLFFQHAAVARQQASAFVHVARQLGRRPGGSTSCRLLAADVLLAGGAAAEVLPLLAATLRGEKALDRAALEQIAGAAYLQLGDAERAERYLRRALSREPTADTRAPLLDKLCRLLIQRGEYLEVRQLAQRALDDAPAEPSRALLLEDLAVAQMYLDQVQAAQENLDRALASETMGRDPRQQVRCLSYRAIVAFRRGQVDRAARSYAGALEIAQKHDLPDLCCTSALNLATAQQQLGQWGIAYDGYERALRLARALGKRNTELTILFNQANLLAEIGLTERASTLLRQLDSRSKAYRLAHLAAERQRLRGEILVIEKRDSAAQNALSEARRRFQQRGALREGDEVTLMLAALFARRGDLAAAGACLEDAEMAKRAEMALDLAVQRGLLRASVANDHAEKQRAMSELEQIREPALSAGLANLVADIDLALAQIYRGLGAADLAAKALEQARRYWQRVAISLPASWRAVFWTHPRRAGLGQAEARDAAETPSNRRFRADQLLLFLQINKRINSSLSVDKVLEEAMDAAITLVRAERGFVLLRNPSAVVAASSQSTRPLSVAVARNIDRESLSRSHLRFSHGIATEVIEQQLSLLTVDAATDARFRDNASVHAMQLKSVLCVPIRTPDGVLGALYLDNRFATGGFSESDQRLLQAFADQVAIALTNARLHAELAERERQLQVEKRRVDQLMRGQQRQVARLQQQARAHQRQLEWRHDYGRIVAKSERMQRLLATLERVVDSDLSVLIEGESGTGKELVARAIHFNSQRKKGPFISLNCAALPEAMLESELFGHQRGAFTGAEKDRPGLLFAANGGTLLLDELGEMSPTIQVKLLRALQEREVRPLGANRTVPIDIRVVAATNRSLKEAVRTGHFREGPVLPRQCCLAVTPPLAAAARRPAADRHRYPPRARAVYETTPSRTEQLSIGRALGVFLAGQCARTPKRLTACVVAGKNGGDQPERSRVARSKCPQVTCRLS